MKFPLSWLKEYIDIELPPLEIAKILTLAGLEVESLDRAGVSFEKVVIGEVLSVEPHPNADKLNVAIVSDGLQKVQVVCAADNCKAGMKTAFAPIGALLTLPSGEHLKIKKSKIRGVDSFGMLCAGVELGISGDDNGIIEFAPQNTVGADIAEIYSDTIFDVALTPNLSHAASLIGIARELAAAMNLPLKLPLIMVKENGKEKIGAAVKVEVKDAVDCPRYACRVVTGDLTGPSPDWMQKRLVACGIRSVNLAADVTNYVLMEMGQPLHAFDLDKLDGHKIVVRKAHADEKIVTLDEKERNLTTDMLVIADDKSAQAIAGVMGGLRSEISPTTKRIVIESAYFKPMSVRKTAKKIGLSSESSKRFERGVDPNGIVPALDRAAQLMQEIAGAEVLQGVTNIQAEEYAEKTIRCRLERVNQILGTHLSLSEVEGALQRLQFKTEWDENAALIVKVPTFRVDVNAEIDLIEEVARVIGYANIPRHTAQHSSSTLADNPLFTFEREVRTRMIAEGLQEFLTCDLIGPSLLEIAKDPKMPADALIKVMNPISVEQSILRTSLLQGLLQVVKFNFDHDNHNVSGFEVGRVHFKADGQYSEPTALGIIIMGNRQPHHIDPKPQLVDFYDIKGIIENLLEGLNIKRYAFRFSHLETFHSGRQALVQVDGVDVGSLGEIHPAIQRKLDIPERIYFAELNLSDLLKAKRGDLRMRPIPQYPASERDWTVKVLENVPVQQLLGSIHHIPSKLLEDVSLVDIFRSQKLGTHVKNVTLHFVYRDKTRTVAQEEVDAEHARIIAAVEHMLGTPAH